MPFEPGKEKTGGRKKGTPNKDTYTLRAWVGDLLDKNREQIEKDLKKLQPRDRVMIFEKLLRYALPTLQSVNVKSDLQKFLSEATESGQLTDDQLKQLAALIVEQLKTTNDNE